jgi:uncharacterized protein YeeX (DUF496 family)
MGTIENKLKEMSEKFAELTRAKNRFKNELTQVNKALQDMQPKFVALLDDSGLQNFKMPEIGTFYIAEDLYPKIENKDELVADLKKRRLGSLLKTDINWSTLKATIKELVLQNKPLLKGVVVTPVRTVRVLGINEGGSDEE